jgi:5'-deoxynucleotidase YfbR-like HD superfamily hydrolase
VKNLHLLYESGAVKRFHTKRVIQETTVAHHTWGVMLILFDICEPSVNLLAAALYHDSAEIITGDVPAPAKWHHAGLDAELLAVERQFETDNEINYLLTEHEQNLLKWADSLELILYADSEFRMGNQAMGKTINSVVAMLRRRKAPSPRAAELLEAYGYER